MMMVMMATYRCLQRLSSAATLNGFTTDLDVRWTAVGDDPSQSINVGATKCSGLWAVKDSEWINQESSDSINVSMTPLLDIVKEWIDSTETIDLFKIDVEGSEMAVLHSAVPLFAANRIGSVYAEIAPGRAIDITPINIILETIEGIYKAGYDIRYASSQKKLDLAEAKAHFADERARYRNDPNMFAISKVAAAGSNP
jgi:FkbM family methyltransferase